ncbi:hypothetical protein [Sphingobacterium sp. JB170]|uniref:hypothetical protein n=1 Tax=Sphingobacterium sp. JB170 TaxID=1434842 RepID=UPI00097F39E5|nr:hypothetical protein [Sphingobacterium sp. JB170]SJN36304.1 hypothetical protein FM107_08805 [Sphingobacterium sp. JB170]
MKVLRFKPFSKGQLIEGLREKLPDRKITANFGAIQVRTSGFTLTGSIGLKIKPERGMITMTNGRDMVVILLFLFLPLGIYVLARSRRIKALEAEVIAGLNELLKPDDQ